MQNKVVKIWLATVCCIALGTALFFAWEIRVKRNQAPDEFLVKTLKFVFEIKNESNQAIENAKFSSYLPLDSDVQQMGELAVSEEYSVREGGFGNRVLETELGLVPPFGAKKLTIAVDVKTRLNNISLKAKPNASHRASEQYIEAGSERIAALAKKLQGDTKLQTATNIYQWVAKNIGDAGYTSQDKGALYALTSGKGDCTEFMYLTIALARVAGIDARGMAGYVYRQSSIVKPADYHNWAELFFDGKWHVVDAQRSVFMKDSEAYIGMRDLSDKNVSLRGNTHRFSVVNDNLKVKML